jgi:hypothetical protein
VASRFGDVRVIDADSRQIPYLVERSSEPLSIELSLARLSTRPGALGPSRASETVYRISRPYAGLPSPRLVLSTTRACSNGQSMWRRARAGPAEVALPHELGSEPMIETHPTPQLARSVQDDYETLEPGDRVLLIVEEGDNTPLPIEGARLLLPAYRMRLFRERGQSLRLAYGRTDLAAPSYDLALLAPRVFGVSAVEVTPGPEREERAAGAAALVAPWLFWGILIAAVVVLLGLIARLVRKPAA